MFEFFKKYPLENEKKLSHNRVNKIKYSVLSQIEEEIPMKKRFKIKPLIIAAIMAITALPLAITVGASNDEQTMPYSVKINGKAVPFTVEYTRSPNYLYNWSWDKTVVVHDESTIIKFELPEEIVISGDNKISDIHTETYTEDGYNIMSSDYGSDFEVMAYLKFGYEKRYSNGQYSINIEYDEKMLDKMLKNRS